MIDKYLNTGKRLYTCFVDFKKAFDTIWREGLFYKLLNQGIDKSFVKLLISMYSRQISCVNIGDYITKSFQTTTGLKQGCNLSPNLFNIFIDDITNCFDTNKCDPAKLITENINCLLYADDLVLISDSATGLQNCLNSLNQYTKKWKLSINFDKTKAMIISKRAIKSKQIFTIGDTKIDICTSYKYLGTQINNNGSFKGNSIMLNKKAIGAMFALLKTMNKYYAGNVKILLDLFDKMVVPIALYNCEVWGNILLPKNEKITNYFSEGNIVNIVEQLQNKFLKYMLGINTKSTNWVARSELGRRPLTMTVYERIIKYFQHTNKSKSNIIQEAMQTNKNLYQNGNKSWYTGFKRILQYIEIDESKVIELKPKSKDINKIMTKLYDITWEGEREKIKHQGKHHLYAEIKTNNCLEKYFEIDNMNIRKAIAKMRTSSHKFPIETGRYERKERYDRICPLCCNNIGDEHHYIFECEDQNITNTREKYMRNILKKSPQLEILSSIERLKYMLICKDESLIKDIGILFLKIQKEFENCT